jgi:hypothetical protein
MKFELRDVEMFIYVFIYLGSEVLAAVTMKTICFRI